MPIMTTLVDEGTAPVKIWTDDIEDSAMQQLRNLSRLPFIHKHVAVMPDVHWGMGSTVGSVIPTIKAIVPAAVGVDIGCFVGETRVPLLNGTQKTLLELYEETEPFWVYSLDTEARIVPGRAICLQTRKDSELVRVVVSGGEEIVCTPDHEFMLSDGSFKEARDLVNNDSLMPLYRRWDTKEGYEKSSCGRGFKLTHHLVWRALHGEIPRGYVVHHDNIKSFDNRPENLEMMTYTEYMRNRRMEFLSSVRDNGKRGASYLTKFNTSPRTCADCDHVAQNPASLRWHKKRAHSNHRVLSVTPLTRRDDVYCLQVEEHHNFALAAGVFVHNCGMVAHKLNIRPDQLPDNLSDVRSAIEKAVPHGRTDNGGRNDRGAWGELPLLAEAEWTRLSNDARLLEVVFAHPTIMKGHVNSGRHLGTLGTGNHFIELCLDKEGGVWLMLHSGSRGIGNRIGSFFIEQAKRAMETWNISLPDPDLAYIPEQSPLFGPYWKALSWAQDYARTNRDVMMHHAKQALSRALGLPVETGDVAVNCHHNYVAVENHFGQNVYVTRKGAVRAREGDMGIIPGSMGARSYIVRGKGNPDSFHSCSHGAGRRMSRGAAKKMFTVDDLAKQTEGVECRKDADVIDEIPGAYKPIDQVMANQADLVEIVHELRQVLCVKG